MFGLIVSLNKCGKGILQKSSPYPSWSCENMIGFSSELVKCLVLWWNNKDRGFKHELLYILPGSSNGIIRAMQNYFLDARGLFFFLPHCFFFRGRSFRLSHLHPPNPTFSNGWGTSPYFISYTTLKTWKWFLCYKLFSQNYHKPIVEI